jgi:hypothetical protein
MVYKIDLSVYETQINELNTSWLTQHRAQNPKDNVTLRYVNIFTFGGFGYVVKDSVTEQYITDFVGVVDDFPFWHEPDKTIQIYQTFSGFNFTALNMPELAIYRRDNNIITYQESNGFYFYVNNLLPEHRTLFETNTNLEITINED